METPTNPSNDASSLGENAESLMKLEALRSSRIPDQKNVFSREGKEEAFALRYGKTVKIAVTYDLNPDNTLKEYTLRFETPKRYHYSVTEYLKNDVTDYVLLCYRKDGRNIENKFSRFVDAEVTLADLISQEV